MNNLKNKNILITGGLGFIGSNLARKLVELNAKVTIIDSLSPSYGGNRFNIIEFTDKVEVHEIDIRDGHKMQELIADKDYIFNLAAQSSHSESMIKPIEDLEINVVSMVSMLENCREINNNVKIIHASTRQIYGKPQCIPVDESHPINPPDVNGINKFSAEQYLELYKKIHNINYCSLRLTNTFGPGMRIKDAKQTFIGIWIRLLLENKDITIYGDGSQIRDLCYVDDCVDAFILATSDKANGRTYNVGGPSSITLKDLANLVIKVNESGSYNYVEYPSGLRNIDIGDYTADTHMIESDLGWISKISLEEGIRKTISFYKKNAEHYL